MHLQPIGFHQLVIKFQVVILKMEKLIIGQSLQIIKAALGYGAIIVH